MNSIKCISLNCRGLRDKSKRITLFQFLKKQKSHITFLQETHSKLENEKSWQNECYNKILFNHSSDKTAGQAIILNSNHLKLNKTGIVIPGRIQFCEIEHNDKKVLFVNIYAPNSDTVRVDFFEILRKFLLHEITWDNIVVGGDFNVVQNSLLDKIGGVFSKKKSQAVLSSLQKELNIIDIWRIQNPNKKAYTWYQKSPNIRCRLDYFLVSKSLVKTCQDSKIYDSIKTDHKIISLKLDLGHSLRGPGFWKLNTSLLHDNDYVSIISNLIEQKWLEHADIRDIRVRWDLLKFEIQTATIQFSKYLAKARRQKESAILKQIEELDTKIVNDTASNDDLCQYEILKDEYEYLQEYKAKGSYIRSRIQNIQEDEKSTKYFYNQAKISYEKKSITKIKGENDTFITNPKQISHETQLFYSRLYESSKSNLCDHAFRDIENVELPQLTSEEQSHIDSKITLSECKDALNAMADNKAPGHDGFGAEFYKVFWPTIGPLFHQTLEYSLDKGELPQSQRRAVITLLQKKGKDESFIKNWRPISLLNCDYKIFTKLLSRRIKPFLPKLIHHDQVGFIPDRFIGENIRYVEDLIEYCRKFYKKCIILNIDIEKAFDTLEWDFIFVTLHKYNFGPNIINWIKACHHNIFSTVMNNGFSSGWFRIYRGVRQGCSLSCILFVLAIEIMAALIRKNENIKGVSIKRYERKLVQFADDTSCILNDTNSIQYLFRTITYFGQFSGLKLNMEKSILFWVGPWKTKLVPQNTKVVVETGSINILGVYLGYDKNKNIKENFDVKLASMRNKFNMWTLRDLTILGKVLNEYVWNPGTHSQRFTANH